MIIKKCLLLATIGVIFLSGINLVEASNAIIWDTMVSESDRPYGDTRFASSNAYANRVNWVQVPYDTTSWEFTGSALLENGDVAIFLHDMSVYESPFFYGMLDGGYLNAGYSQAGELYGSYGVAWDSVLEGYTIITNTPDEIKIRHDAHHRDPVTYPGTVRTYFTLKSDVSWFERQGVDSTYNYVFSLHARSPDGFGFAPPDYGTAANDYVVDSVKDSVDFPNTYPTHYPLVTHNEMIMQDLGTWDHSQLYMMMPSNPNDASLKIKTNTGPSKYASGFIESISATGVSSSTSVFIGQINHRDTIKSIRPYSKISLGETYRTNFVESVPGIWRMSVRIDNNYYTYDVTNSDFSFIAPESGTLQLVVWYLYDRNANTPTNVYTPMDMYRAAHKETTPPPSIEQSISIRNPGFESGTSSWLFHTSGTGTFIVASPGFDGSTAAKFALNSGGTNIQLYQKEITLEPNTRYRLSFAGYSTSGHDVMVRLIKHVSPYNNYGLDLTADLGTSWQKFTTEFTTTGFTGTVNDGRLQFWLAPFAASGDTYYIDDIRLEKVDEVYPTEPDTTVTTVIQNTSLDHPNMYINQNEINAIKAKVLANQEPWKSAYNQMISDANRALSQAPLSVTYTGNSGHDYYTETPYITDGVFNPGADREDYTAAKDMGKAVRSLGLAYAFTGDSAYADKAIELIDYWCLNSSTYMTPSVETNLQSHIELYITMPGMFYGADLIYDYTGWDSADKADFLDWVEDIAINAQNTDLTGVCNVCMRGNYENWRHNFVASAGSLLDDNTLLSYAFNDFKTHIPNQISSNGEITSELRRTKSLDYSMYAINAMVQTAEIARHQGVNLYDYTSNGRNLELALDYHAPYVVNSSTWPYEQISVYDGSTNGNAQVYELAYSYWQKAPYLNVLNYWGRPMYEIRILGPVTLTHSLGSASIIAPIPAPPTINTYLENPGFESGTSSWLFHTSETGTLSVASPGFEGSNAAKLALNSGSTNIQLYQKEITLEPNTRYRLSFAGYSTTGHDVNLRLIKHVSPYTNYGLDFMADFGTNWQTFTTEFTSSGLTNTVNDGRLMFWLAPFAASGDTYYIDDIRLEKVNDADTTLPKVTGNEPTGTNVPVTTQIHVTFSGMMDQASVESAFSTSPATEGSFRWSDDTVTYTPSSDLAFNTIYTVTIGTGAMNLAGNLLELPHSWEFTTEHENIPPTVTDNTPTGTSVPVTAQVIVTFSETMDQTSVESAFSTSPATEGSFSWNDNTLTYTPASGLTSDTTYKVTIGTGAMDLADNSLQTEYTWKFTSEVVQTSNNLILNPRFESGTTPWLFYTNGKGTFLNDASGDGSPHAGHITISQKGSNVQLYQPGLVLEPNTLYRLSFKAYSNTGHDLSISLHKHESPYTNYGLSDYVVNLGTSWSEYSTQFTTSEFSGTVNDGRLKFWLVPYNAIGDQYFIEDIILVEV